MPRTDLRQLIVEHSYRTGDFVLSSGACSRFFFDIKPLALHPTAGPALFKQLAALIAAKVLGAQAVGGPAVGAIPIVTGLVGVMGLPGFYVLKEAKDHGADPGKLIVGLPLDMQREGVSVVMVEDVTTTGESMMRAIRPLRDAGMVVRGCFSVLDREAGAADLFHKEGLPFLSLFKARSFTGES